MNIMLTKYTNSSLEHLTTEIFSIFRETDPSITEVWCEISEISFFKDFTYLELNDFIDKFEFVSLKKGNYSNYIVLDKILFIIECINFISYDIKNLSEILDYSGFEILIKEILQKNNYLAVTNFRFSNGSKSKSKTPHQRYEIDVVGIYLKYVLVIDAKQWRKKDSFSSLNKAANLQYHRVKSLTQNPEAFLRLVTNILGKAPNLKRHLPFTLIPIMVTLEDNGIKLNEKQVPLVSIYEFNAFLQELPNNLHYFETAQVSKINLHEYIKSLTH